MKINYGIECRQVYLQVKFKKLQITDDMLNKNT